MPKKPVISPLMAKAAAPPPADPSVPKKNVSVRMELPYVESLASMAKALRKQPSTLAAELLEAAIQDFSSSLGDLRPDLCREPTADELEAEEYAAHAEGRRAETDWRVPTWTTPQQVFQRLMDEDMRALGADPDELRLNDQVAAELAPEINARIDAAVADRRSRMNRGKEN